MPSMIQVDYHNFLDALEIADHSGERLRIAEREQFQRYCSEQRIDLLVAQSISTSMRQPKMAIILKGLMSGLYVYSLEDEVCFRYLDYDQSFQPLPKSSSTDYRYDFTISYGSPDLQRVGRLRDELTQANLETFWIDVSEDPNDPIWQIRFREGMFYSRFLFLYLTDFYLRGEGAAWEVFEAARLTLRARRSCFFYPMILLVESYDELVELDWSQKSSNRLLRELDQDGFEWIRHHVYPIALNQGEEWIRRFARSLIQNDSNGFDADFLHCLAPQMTAMELHDFGERTVTLFLRHPWLTNYTLMINSQGSVTRFVGVHEPGRDAFRADAFSDPVDAIVRHLQGEDVSPASTKSASTVAGRRLPELPSIRLGDESVDLQLNHEATRLLTRFGNRPATLFDLQTGKALCETESKVDVATLSNSGEVFAVGTHSGLLAILDESGAKRQSLDQFSDGVYSLAWSPDGEQLAVGTFLMRDLHLLSTNSLETLLTIPKKELFLKTDTPLFVLFGVVFSPDGEKFATTAIDRLALWNSEGEELAMLHENACYHAGFSPSGTMLAGGFYDGTLRVFRVSDANEEYRLSFNGPVMQMLWLSESDLLIRHRTRSNGPHRLVAWRLGMEHSIPLENLFCEGPASISSNGILLSEDTQLDFRSLDEIQSLLVSEE